VLYRFGLYTRQAATLAVTPSDSSSGPKLTVKSTDGSSAIGHNTVWLDTGCHLLEVTLQREAVTWTDGDEVALLYQQVYPFVSGGAFTKPEGLAIVPQSQPLSATSLAQDSSSSAASQLMNTAACMTVDPVCRSGIVAASIVYDQVVRSFYTVSSTVSGCKTQRRS
jgi:hypothetical protein